MIELIIVIVVWLILGFVGVFLLTRDMKDYKFTNGDVVFFGFLLFLGAFTFVAGIMDFFIEYLPYWIGEKGIKKGIGK